MPEDSKIASRLGKVSVYALADSGDQALLVPSGETCIVVSVAWASRGGQSRGTSSMNRKAIVFAIGIALICGHAGLTVDLSRDLRPPSPPVEIVSIRGAIAYSQADGEYGFLWGADKRREAEEIAVRHCENAGRKTCALVTRFGNHRHWDGDDGSGFPYNHCAALAVNTQSSCATSPWAAASATTRKNAEGQALHQCGAGSAQCKIREWVCT